MELLFKRQDGTFVATINGIPYHVTHDDELYVEALETAEAMGEELSFEPIPQAPAIDSEVVNAERDRRIVSGFTFAGVLYDFTIQAKADITAAGAMAGIAAIAGAQPGNLFWSDPETEFKWIAADNSRIPMDAQTCIAFSRVAMKHYVGHIEAARNLKDMKTIPADYADDKYWP